MLAASLRIGGIQPYKALPAQPDNPLSRFPSRDIPIPERFFAGGDASHRAYSRDDLGIRGETLLPNASGDGFVPVGGNGLLLLNLEYRFPVFGDFGGTVFFDSGNIWPDWRSINLGEVSNGVGIGARYISPIGPLRAGIGWKLDRETGEPATSCSSISGIRSRAPRLTVALRQRRLPFEVAQRVQSFPMPRGRLRAAAM